METPAEYDTPQTPKSAIIALLEDRPIAYHPLLAKVLGGVKQAVFVSQLLYWTGKGKRADGFIWKKQEEWTDETGLSANEQRTARKHLVKSGVLQEKLKGIPARLYYRIDTDALQARLTEYHNQEIHNVEILHSTTSTAIPEITSEITTEGEGASAPHAPAGDEWPTEPAEQEPETPPPNPAQERLQRMRSKFGDDPVSVAAHCAEQQATEGSWTVPTHSGLSPACAVFKEATGYRPGTAARPVIDETIPNNEEALHNWFKVCQGWMLTYDNYKNVAGMLDWYAEGRVGRDKPNGNGNGGASGGRSEGPRIASATVVYGGVR